MSTITRLDVEIDTDAADWLAEWAWATATTFTDWDSINIKKCLGSDAFKSIDQVVPGSKRFRSLIWVMPPGCIREWHIDNSSKGTSKYQYGLGLGEIVAIHVPLRTNPDAFHESDKGLEYFDVGEALALDVTERHQVGNLGVEPRLVLLLDTFVDDELYALLHEADQTGAGHEENRIEDEADYERIGDAGTVADEHEPCCEDQCPACQPEQN